MPNSRHSLLFKSLVKLFFTKIAVEDLLYLTDCFITFKYLYLKIVLASVLRRPGLQEGLGGLTCRDIVWWRSVAPTCFSGLGPGDTVWGNLLGPSWYTLLGCQKYRILDLEDVFTGLINLWSSNTNPLLQDWDHSDWEKS